jgi:hypothetical protein
VSRELVSLRRRHWAVQDHARAWCDSAALAALARRLLPFSSDLSLDRTIAETRGNPLALVELPRGLTAAELAVPRRSPSALRVSWRRPANPSRGVRPRRTVHSPIRRPRSLASSVRASRTHRLLPGYSSVHARSNGTSLRSSESSTSPHAGNCAATADEDGRPTEHDEADWGSLDLIHGCRAL